MQYCPKALAPNLEGRKLNRHLAIRFSFVPAHPSRRHGGLVAHLLPCQLRTASYSFCFRLYPVAFGLSCSCPPQHRLAEHVDLTDLLGVPRLMNFGVCMQKSQSRMSDS